MGTYTLLSFPLSPIPSFTNTINQLSKTKANSLIIFRLCLVPYLLLYLPLSWPHYLRLSPRCGIPRLRHVLMHPRIRLLSSYVLRLYAHLSISISMPHLYKPLLWHRCYLLPSFCLFSMCLALYLHTLRIHALLKLIYWIFPKSPFFLPVRIGRPGSVESRTWLITCACSITLALNPLQEFFQTECRHHHIPRPSFLPLLPKTSLITTLGGMQTALFGIFFMVDWVRVLMLSSHLDVMPMGFFMRLRRIFLRYF